MTVAVFLLASPRQCYNLLRRGRQRSGYNDGGVDVDVGVGVNSAGDGETSGDGAAEAMENLVLTSSSSFFSSW